MKNKVKIICTLGPASLNPKFLSYSKKNIDLLRLNMSHQTKDELIKNIRYIKKYTSCPICIDTEGAQIRSKITNKKFLKKNNKILIKKNNGNFLNFYPNTIYGKLKINDILNIGFENLKIKVSKIEEKNISARVISSGYVENNKGVHLENRKIKLDCLTEKDLQAVKAGKEHNIINFALSFANSVADVEYFNKLTNNNLTNIFKIETKKAVNEFEEIIKKGNNFLIDRGDLSKDINIIKIPEIQRKLMIIKKKYKNKKIFVATNLLESMILNNYPTRGEANDIYSSIEMGADGLVLAAETAIGRYPIECVEFVKKMINQFK
jgi:pyruvate kinase